MASRQIATEFQVVGLKAHIVGYTVKPIVAATDDDVPPPPSGERGVKRPVSRNNSQSTQPKP